MFNKESEMFLARFENYFITEEGKTIHISTISGYKLIQKVLSKFHLKVLIFQQKAKKAFEPPRFLVE